MSAMNHASLTLQSLISVLLLLSCQSSERGKASKSESNPVIHSMNQKASAQTKITPSLGQDFVEAKVSILAGDPSPTYTVTPNMATPTSLPDPTDSRGASELICQEGPKIIANGEHHNYQDLFDYICTSNRTNDFYSNLLANAYNGTNQTQVIILQNTVSDLFVTRFVYAYAVKLAKPDPSAVLESKLHDKISQKIFDDRSRLYLTVESRRAFPGNGRVEELVLHYDLRSAMGAGLFDHRRSVLNTYLLKEGWLDTVIISEKISDPEHTPYYQDARGIQILAASSDKMSTYLVNINELVVKNRIDPKRVADTITSLSKVTQKALYNASLP